MKGEVEHANINVRDLDEAVTFLTTALPHFKVRFRGKSETGDPWFHIGTDSTYIALNLLSPDITPLGDRLNHVGFVVDDAEAVQKRCLAAGYQGGWVDEPHPHRKRIYIRDHEGLEWEFVEYLSEDPAERNDYSDA